jgi:hypothetical protein
VKSLLPVDENEDPFRVGMRDELTLCEGDVINGGVQASVDLDIGLLFSFFLEL